MAGLGRELTYRVPPALEGRIAVGSRVRVPLRGRRVGGWVVDDDVDPPSGVTLEAVAHVSGLGPPEALIDLARWGAWRWAGPVPALLTAASPDRVVQRLPGPPARDGASAVPTAPAAPAAPAAASAAGPDEGGPLAEPVRSALAAPGEPVLARLPPDGPVLELVGRLLVAVAGRGTTLVLAPAADVAERLARALDASGHAVARAGSDWDRAASGWPVVVGVRSAAWSPPGRLAGAVVLDAHDDAYREERMPTFNAWEVVVERCRRDRAPCLLVSPAPGAALLTAARLWAPPRPMERAGWPMVRVDDMREADPRTGLLPRTLVRHVEGALASSNLPAVCVLNRRGRSRLLACGSCKELARCAACEGPVEEPGGDDPGGVLRCRWCGTERPAVCANCGSTRLKALRPGVSRVREELAALLRREVAEVSGTAGAPDEQVRVLVGTEAVLHRVRRASLVAFLDLDQHLLAPAVGAGEATMALLVRAGRMVGGRSRRAPAASGAPPGVVLQTRQPDHDVVRAAQLGDPGPAGQHGVDLRRELDLPPFVAWALLTGEGAGELAAGLTGALGVTVRPVGDGRWLVQAPDHRRLADVLAAAERPRRRVRIDVDPPRI